MTFLLDVNVLFLLLVSRHSHRAAASGAMRIWRPLPLWHRSNW